MSFFWRNFKKKRQNGKNSNCKLQSKWQKRHHVNQSIPQQVQSGNPPPPPSCLKDTNYNSFVKAKMAKTKTARNGSKLKINNRKPSP